MGFSTINNNIMQILEGESLDDEYIDEVNEKEMPEEESSAKTVASDKFYYTSQSYN